MSYITIAQSVTDAELCDRLRAAIASEAFTDATHGATYWGILVRQFGPDAMMAPLVWITSIDNEAAYETAVLALDPLPNAAITDAAILTSVQSNWPVDPA